MKVLILAAKEKGDRHNRWIAPLDTIDGVTYRLVLKFRSYVPFIFRSFWATCRFKPDIIISMGADLVGVTAIIISKLASHQPVILSLGGDPVRVRLALLRSVSKRSIFNKSKYKFLYYLNLHCVVKNSQHFIVNSHHLRKQLLFNNHYFKSKHIFVVPQSISTIPRSKKLTIANNDNSIRILTVTNLAYRAKYYGVLELVEFLRKYTAQNSLNLAFVLDICGDGNFGTHLRKKLTAIAGKQAKLSIRYHGFVESLESMYEGGHIFLYSSSFDSLPRALLEAQTYDLPVLVNDFEAFQELVAHGYNGLLYKTGCFADFKKKLDMLVNNPQLRYSLSKNAIENLKRNYSDEIIGKKLEGVLLEVLAARKESLK